MDGSCPLVKVVYTGIVDYDELVVRWDVGGLGVVTTCEHQLPGGTLVRRKKLRTHICTPGATPVLCTKASETLQYVISTNIVSSFYRY